MLLVGPPGCACSGCAAVDRVPTEHAAAAATLRGIFGGGGADGGARNLDAREMVLEREIVVVCMRRADASGRVEVGDEPRRCQLKARREKLHHTLIGTWSWLVSGFPFRAFFSWGAYSFHEILARDSTQYFRRLPISRLRIFRLGTFTLERSLWNSKYMPAEGTERKAASEMI